jgi:hypothetical protein
VWIAGGHFPTQGELITLQVMKCRRHLHLDTKRIWFVRFALADAFHARRVQFVNFLVLLLLKLFAQAIGEV